MIFIEKIEKIGEKRTLHIPNMYEIQEGSYNEVDCGGAMEEDNYAIVDGGHADIVYEFELIGGFALFEGGIDCNIELVHTISRKSFASVARPTNINDNYFDIEVTFNEIPPLGQYHIVLVDGQNNKIYDDLLQIGNFDTNNKTYNKEIKIKIYER